MRFVIDLDLLELIESATDRRRVTQIEAKRGDDLPFEVVFVRSGVAEELAPSTVLTFGAKEEGKYDSAAVVLDDGFTLTGSGTTAKYTANPSFNTEALNALFLIDANDANDPVYVDLMAEFTWQIGSGAPTTTRTFRVRVHNDVIRDDEFSPTPAYSPIGDTAPVNQAFAYLGLEFATIPIAGDTIAIQTAYSGELELEEWSFVAGTPVGLQIQIGATDDDCAANFITALMGSSLVTPSAGVAANQVVLTSVIGGAAGNSILVTSSNTDIFSSPIDETPLAGGADTTLAPPYIRVADGFFYIQEDGVWKKTALGTARNNYEGTTAPTVTNDATEGYSLGSKWYDTVADEVYVCTSATEGAAAWLKVGAAAYLDVGTTANTVAAGDHTHVSAPVYYYTIAGSWATLANWFRDSLGTIPATELPGPDSDVVLLANCSTGSNQYTIRNLIVDDTIDLSSTISGLWLEGIICKSAVFRGPSSSNSGTIIAENGVFFTGFEAINSGDIQGAAYFSGDETANVVGSVVDGPGYFINPATQNQGTCSIVITLAAQIGAADLVHTHAITDLDITGGTEIGGALADGDKIIVLKADGSVVLSSLMSRVWTFIKASADLVYSTLVTAEVSITGATTLNSTAFGKIHTCSGTTADYAVTLPAASGNAGKKLTVVMSPTLTKLVTLTANGAELIDGQNTRIMWAGESATLYCNGTGWIKLQGISKPMAARCSLATAGAGAQSISNDEEVVDMTLSEFDSIGTMVNLGSNQIEIKRTSFYIAAGVINWDNAAGWSASRIYGRIQKNGSVTLSSDERSVAAGGYSTNNPYTSVALSAGDYLRLTATQNTGSAKPLFGNSLCYLQVLEVPMW